MLSLKEVSATVTQHDVEHRGAIFMVQRLVELDDMQEIDPLGERWLAAERVAVK